MNIKLTLLILLLLSLLSGCSQQQETNVMPIKETQWPDANAQTHTHRELPLTNVERTFAARYPQLVFSHTALDDITLYEVRPDQSRNAPMVIFLHEQGVNKDEYLELATSCAQAGYFCVLMDLPGHGERICAQTMQSIEMVTAGSADIDLLLAYYRLSPFADSSRFSLLGISMGGSVAYHYASFGKQSPSGMLVCSAAVDFSELYAKGSMLEGKEQPPTWDRETFLRYCETCNPINHMDRLRQIPLLAIYGSQDKIVNIDGIRSFADNLATGGNARFIFLEQAHHEVTKYLQPYVLPTLSQFLK